MADQPTGTVTFLFTDIEESTRLWEHYPEAMNSDLARHDALLHAIIAAHGGRVFKTMAALCKVNPALGASVTVRATEILVSNGTVITAIASDCAAGSQPRSMP